MSSESFFPKDSKINPKIYAYTDERYNGMLKIGYTTINVEDRVRQQYPINLPSKSYNIVFIEPAIRNDGSEFTDHDIHRILKEKGFLNPGGEWFECSLKDLKSAYISVRDRIDNIEGRTEDFKMRPEQSYAVDKTIKYFQKEKKNKSGKVPKFLWNAKMRFGKTFASYQLAKKMNMKKVLVLTFKPAVENSWYEDLASHVDFEGWQFVSKTHGMPLEDVNLKKPLVCFGSFQDFLGVNENGGIKEKNEWVHTINWDLVIFDEYHYGAWRENAKSLFEISDEDRLYEFDMEQYKKEEADNAYNETFLPITTSYYLFLSGTPFRALNSGEFIEDQIFNWTYTDEQKAKKAWGNKPNNPYKYLPRMIMFTYTMPEEIRKIALKGEYNEFDLNEFFSAEGKFDKAEFKYKDEVQKWLDLIRGAYLPTNTDALKQGLGKKPPMPYSDVRLLNGLNHTFWFLPNVSSCYAMKNLLIEKQNKFYHDYKIIVSAGNKAGIGVEALKTVRKVMENPIETKTITLSCGKLTTGVTVKPWSGILMLRNLSSPETYFQAAFRVQSPWVINSDDGKKEIIKSQCYIFDFALNRALRQISDYSCRLDVNESDPEKKVQEFINFLPVIAYDGSSMKEVNAEDILDIAMAGTSATLLAKRWESALLVNVDNDTLSRLIDNERAMEALMNIEGFRSLNKDIEIIINKSKSIKEKKQNKEKLSKKEKKHMTDEEKEYQNLRKQIQEKLIKFATRIPIFMYLTDYRENNLKDVISQLEPGLFKRVTGLDVSDFDLLISLGVFNGPLMNDAVYKFKRYEDSSLSYSGINKHDSEENIGLWDTVITKEDYKHMFKLQQASLGVSIENIEVDKKENLFKENELKLSKENIKNKEISKKDSLDEYFYMETVKIGMTMHHNKFGLGSITDIKNGRIYLNFEKGDKVFHFPEAIENGYLIIK